MILRRLYLYLVSAAGLGLLAAGLALLGTAALAFLFNAPYASDPSYRAQLAIYTAPQPVAPIHPTASANSHSRRFVLAITDATEDDVHQALANLPPQASYKLTPAEHGAVDVR